MPVLSLGTGTFGGKGEFFKAWGNTDVAEATRLVDICLEAGLNMFDSADHLFEWRSAEEILGQAIKGRRDRRADLDQSHVPRPARAPTIVGSSRYHLIRAVRGQSEASRNRLYRPLPTARLRRDLRPSKKR